MEIDVNLLGLIFQASTKIDVNSLGLFDQALTNVFIGFGLALLNVLVRYFVPFVPRVVSILRWKKEKHSLTRLLIFSYFIAMIFQLVTSWYFRSAFQSVYSELAWSFYQAFWNVAGIVLMDVLVMGWDKTREGVKAGGKQLQEVKSRASETLGDIGVSLPITPEGRVAAEERRKQAAEAELAERDERQKRMDDRLKDY
jgi:hypothetical protein